MHGSVDQTRDHTSLGFVKRGGAVGGGESAAPPVSHTKSSLWLSLAGTAVLSDWPCGWIVLPPALCAEGLLLCWCRKKEEPG